MKEDPRSDTELLGVFGLPWPTTHRVLKTAYRRLAMQYHPDRNPGDTIAEGKFKVLAGAYEALEFRTTPFVEDESEEGILAKTTDGTPLSDLGKGLPRNINGKPCTSCSGKGYQVDTTPGGYTTCPKCNGNTWVREDKCRRCNGTGKYKHPNTGKIVGDCRGCNGTGMHQFERPIPCDNCREERHPFDSIFMGAWFIPRPRGRETVSTGRVRTNVTTYRKCLSCNGTGEVMMDNPVLPRNRIF